jgi:hypothetical protein
MGIDPTRTERVQRGPDPARPPLEMVWHINDAGEYVADISFGSVNPFRAADLIASALIGVLDECQRTDVALDAVIETLRFHTHQIGGPCEQIAAYIEHEIAKAKGAQP